MFVLYLIMYCAQIFWYSDLTQYLSIFGIAGGIAGRTNGTISGGRFSSNNLVKLSDLGVDIHNGEFQVAPLIWIFLQLIDCANLMAGI